MTDTNQLPCEREAFEAFAQNCPMGKYSITRRGDGYDSSHTQLMWDAWQARAQVQGEPVNLQHMAVAENGALRWMTGRKVQNCELYAMPDFGRAPTLYTTPQPAQATQAGEPMTREQISKCIGEVMLNSGYGSHHFGWAIELARAIEAHHGITAQAKKETP